MYKRQGDTYPARLQALLDARVPGGPHRVVNLGIPGLNTRQVLDRLPAAVDEYEPHAVLVLAGVNNLWSWQPDSSVRYAEPPWYEELHLVALARLVASRFSERPVAPREASVATERGERGTRTAGRDREGREYAYEVPTATEELPAGGLESTLATDYRAIDALLREAGVPLVLLTYAWDGGPQARVNAAVRALAPELERPLADAAAAIGPPLAEYGRGHFFYPDTHPRAPGYELFARVVFNRLVAEGLVRGEAVELLEPRTGGRLRVVPAAAPGRPPGIEISGEEPAQPFVLLISEAGAGERGAWRGLATPLRDDELFRAALAVESLRGVTGADGRATVALAGAVPEAEWAPLAGRGLLAAYVVLARDGSLAPRRVSPAVEFSF